MKKKIMILLCLTFAAAFVLAGCNNVLVLPNTGEGKTVSRIEITREADILSYDEGQVFDPTNMRVRAVYTDGSKKNLKSSEYTYAPTGALKPSHTGIVVSYGKFTAVLDITVAAAYVPPPPSDYAEYVWEEYFSNDFDTSACTFYDKFDGNALDETKWGYQTGNGNKYAGWGWGNDERQSYTRDNVAVEDGNLVITARTENNDGQEFTSGKLVTGQMENASGGRTNNKTFDQTFGRFEAKIKFSHALPGMWPAFWMMPTEGFYGGWPYSGEIDIMEMAGAKPHEASSTYHFKGYDKQYGGGSLYRFSDYTFMGETDMTDWHVFGVEWAPTGMKFLIDGYVHKTFNSSNAWHANYVDKNKDKATQGAPFDRDFFLILNMALGGNFGGGNAGGGNIGAETRYALDNGGIRMEVDWVRAWTLDGIPDVFKNLENLPGEFRGPGGGN